MMLMMMGLLFGVALVPLFGNGHGGQEAPAPPEPDPVTDDPPFAPFELPPEEYGEEIHGTLDDERLLGHGGDDHIWGGAGNDTLEGGAGNDTLEGGVGDDLLSGGEGDDLLIGGPGQDRLFGGAGQDVLDGREAEDSPDFLNGGSGADTIYVGAGDYVMGGPDPDLFLLDLRDALRAPPTFGDFLASEDRLVIGYPTTNPPVLTTLQAPAGLWLLGDNARLAFFENLTYLPLGQIGFERV